jgi:hypothetical protein
MAWSTPRSWVAGELVTASSMNEHIRDQFLEIAKLSSFRCFAYNSGSQNVTAGNTTALTLDSEVYDSGTMHDTSSNTNRVTVPAAGYYRILGASAVSNNNNGSCALHLRKNGSAFTPSVQDSFVTAASNFEDQWLHVYSIPLLAANDYVELAGQAVTNDFAFASTQLIVDGITAVS